MHHPYKRNRRKLKARAARWRARKEAGPDAGKHDGTNHVGILNT